MHKASGRCLMCPNPVPKEKINRFFCSEICRHRRWIECHQKEIREHYEEDQKKDFWDYRS